MNVSILFLESFAWMPAAVQWGQLGAQSVRNAPNLAPRSTRPCAPGGRALLTEGTFLLGGHFTKVTLKVTSTSLPQSLPATFSQIWFCFTHIICHFFFFFFFVFVKHGLWPALGPRNINHLHRRFWNEVKM